SSFSILVRPPPLPTLFPYTTLFRSPRVRRRYAGSRAAQARCHGAWFSTQSKASKLRQRLLASRFSMRRFITSGTACSERPPCERSEEHTSELQSLAYLVRRLLLEKK